MKYWILKLFVRNKFISEIAIQCFSTTCNTISVCMSKVSQRAKQDTSFPFKLPAWVLIRFFFLKVFQNKRSYGNCLARRNQDASFKNIILNLKTVFYQQGPRNLTRFGSQPKCVAANGPIPIPLLKRSGGSEQRYYGGRRKASEAGPGQISTFFPQSLSVPVCKSSEEPLQGVGSRLSRVVSSTLSQGKRKEWDGRGPTEGAAAPQASNTPCWHLLARSGPTFFPWVGKCQHPFIPWVDKGRRWGGGGMASSCLPRGPGHCPRECSDSLGTDGYNNTRNGGGGGVEVNPKLLTIGRHCGGHVLQPGQLLWKQKSILHRW